MSSYSIYINYMCPDLPKFEGEPVHTGKLTYHNSSDTISWESDHKRQVYDAGEFEALLLTGLELLKDKSSVKSRLKDLILRLENEI